MLVNYLKIALRNIKRRKLHSFIIILGLVVGFSAFTLIMLWIQNQLSYDTYNVRADRIYLVTSSYKIGGNQYNLAMSAPPLAGALQALPEVQKTVRLSNPTHNVVVRYKDKIFNEKDFLYADSTFFQVFTQHIIEGNPSTALANPWSLVLTESTAKKYFGSEDPLGKVLSRSTRIKRWLYPWNMRRS